MDFKNLLYLPTAKKYLGWEPLALSRNRSCSDVNEQDRGPDRFDSISLGPLLFHLGRWYFGNVAEIFCKSAPRLPLTPNLWQTLWNQKSLPTWRGNLTFETPPSKIGFPLVRSSFWNYINGQNIANCVSHFVQIGINS